MKPLVSIIIATYNARRWLGEAIDSVLAQTYPNCEVILVDDGSTDGTGQFVAERYGDRVRYHWKENGGMGSARSAGLEIASGKYIQHLDSDDILLPHKIESQVAYLETHPEVAFVYSRTLCCYDDDRSNTWEHEANARACSGNLLAEIIRDGNFVNVGTPLFRREWLDRIGGWDADVKSADDQDVMLRLAYAGAEGHFLDGEPVFLYRRRRRPFDPDGPKTWHSPEHKLRGRIYIWEKLRRTMLEDNRPEVKPVELMIGRFEFALGKWFFGERDRKGAVTWMIRGLKLNRERLVYKLVLVVAASCLPAPLLVRLVQLKHRLRALRG